MTNAGISRDNNFSSTAFNQMIEFVSFIRDFTSNYMINEKSSHQTLTCISLLSIGLL